MKLIKRMLRSFAIWYCNLTGDKRTLKQELVYGQSYSKFELTTYGNSFRELLNNAVVETFDYNLDKTLYLTLDDDIPISLHNEVILAIHKEIGLKWLTINLYLN